MDKPKIKRWVGTWPNPMTHQPVLYDGWRCDGRGVWHFGRSPKHAFALWRSACIRRGIYPGKVG